MYHSNGGLIALGVALAVGGSCYIRERFSASEFWSDAIRHDCTLFIYVGELCRYLLNTPPSANDRAHRIRLCLGNGLRPDIFSAFQARFGIRDVLEFYAATEGNIAMFNLDSHPGSVGRVPGWAANHFPVKTVAFDVDEGVERRDARGPLHRMRRRRARRIARRNPRRSQASPRRASTATPMRRRQRRKSCATFSVRAIRGSAPATWSGATRAATIYFVDRIGDTFRWKGETVSTTEVAETIATFPGVLEAAVYGVAVPEHDGRAGMAALVIDNVATFDLAGLRALLIERLPAYARPLFLRFRRKLDLTSTFRPKKSELVAQGFDPARAGDPIFFDDRGQGVYARVDADFVAGVKAGAIQL